jgi:nucleoside-diphosphate-sugar epimerase
MKSFVTGGAGFLGSAVVRRLVVRGDDVVALARSEEAAITLTRLGAVPVRGDITDPHVLGQVLGGVDAVFHIAGAYRIGIRESEHEEMFRVNVDGTTIVLDAAITAGVDRIVYVSTVGVFGNTRGKVVDETYERPDRDFLSYYDATKYLAHRAAVGRQAAGAPVIIAQPGAVYGPGDHSEIGAQIEQAARGKYTIRAFPELGFTMSYVDDVADGLLLVQEKGAAGESYILGGEVTRLGTIVDLVADLTGHKRARLKVPSGVFQVIRPLGPLVGRVAGTGPNLHEVIRASKDVTYWATSAKAERVLGYAPRRLEQGLRDLLAARGLVGGGQRA